MKTAPPPQNQHTNTMSTEEDYEKLILEVTAEINALQQESDQIIKDRVKLSEAHERNGKQRHEKQALLTKYTNLFKLNNTNQILEKIPEYELISQDELIKIINATDDTDEYLHNLPIYDLENMFLSVIKIKKLFPSFKLKNVKNVGRNMFYSKTIYEYTYSTPDGIDFTTQTVVTFK